MRSLLHRISRPGVAVATALAAALAGANATHAASAQSPATPASPPAITAADYAQPHQRVDVDHGRRLNLFCAGAGAGAPTVVFEAGMGNAGWDWAMVHPAVAQHTRACVYDRAGLGFSDPATRAGTSEHQVDDLHRLLAAAGVSGPLVLVGHSHGGRVAQLYAYTYPGEVAGLVIVDSDHEDALARGNRITEGKYGQVDQQERDALAHCVKAARDGFKNAEAAQACLPDEQALYGPVLSKAVRQSHERLAFWDAVQSEQDHYDSDSAAQLRAARKPLGERPLVYLTRGVSPFAPPDRPQSAMNKAFEDDVLQSHEEIARLSTHGVNYVVPGAGHNIPQERPQAVIDAVLAVLGLQR